MSFTLSVIYMYIQIDNYVLNKSMPVHTYHVYNEAFPFAGRWLTICLLPYFQFIQNVLCTWSYWGTTYVTWSVLYILLLFLSEIRKVLSKILKGKGREALSDWVKPYENHLYWSAASTHSGNGLVIYSKFKSFLSLIVNKNSSLPDALLNECAHRIISPRKWLSVGKSGLSFHLFITGSRSQNLSQI